MLLGVNIDHIAVLKEARKVWDPDPLFALNIVKNAGGDQITIHLREDRRHITDYDAKIIVDASNLPVNLECSLNDEIIDIVCKLKPRRATLVPENRQEVTTEGGLDLFSQEQRVVSAISKLHQHEIEVSVFIEPNEKTTQKAKDLKCEWVEFHTGLYANIYAMLNTNLSKTPHSIKELELTRKELEKLLIAELKKIKNSSVFAKNIGLYVAAGHGLNYQNVTNIVNIKEIQELNIGQSIIAKSVYYGLDAAVKEMVKLVK